MESLERVADVVGREYAAELRVLRRAVREAVSAYVEPSSYSAPEAAETLDVTLPTIHAWVEAGVLTTSTDSRRSRLRLIRKRVDAVADRLRDLRRRAPRTRKLRDVLEWLETQEYGDRLRGGRRSQTRTGEPWRETLRKVWGARRSTTRRH